jgi:isocitrate dehydrogenase
MVEALVSAMQYSDEVAGADSPAGGKLADFATNLRKCTHAAMAQGQGTRDLLGPSGLTTEQFIDVVADRMAGGDGSR